MSVIANQKQTVIVASYRIYGEPIAPESGRGQPTKAINGAGEIVEVHHRVGTVELITDIPDDLDPYRREAGFRRANENQGLFRIDERGHFVKVDDAHT